MRIFIAALIWCISVACSSGNKSQKDEIITDDDSSIVADDQYDGNEMEEEAKVDDNQSDQDSHTVHDEEGGDHDNSILSDLDNEEIIDTDENDEAGEPWDDLVIDDDAAVPECTATDTQALSCGGNGSGTQLQKCENNMWINDGDCFRIFKCADKPINTEWNSVAEYIQKWNGSEWIPSDSITSYSVNESESSCVYICASNYAWNNTALSCSDCAGNFPHLHNGHCWSDPAPETMSWSNSITYCQDAGGRLPSISEARVLIQNCAKAETDGLCGVTDLCLENSCWNADCDGCSYDTSGKYSCFNDSFVLWSSSFISNFPENAWAVAFSYGAVSPSHKSNSHNVRCVR